MVNCVGLDPVKYDRVCLASLACSDWRRLRSCALLSDPSRRASAATGTAAAVAANRRSWLALLTLSACLSLVRSLVSCLQSFPLSLYGMLYGAYHCKRCCRHRRVVPRQSAAANEEEERPKERAGKEGRIRAELTLPRPSLAPRLCYDSCQCYYTMAVAAKATVP